MRSEKKQFEFLGFRVKDFMPVNSSNTRLAMMLIIIFVTLALLKPTVFLTKEYLVNMLYLFPEFGIMALGMMLCMISGGIDLSIVGNANLASIISCIFLIRFIPQDASAGRAVIVLILAVILAMIIGAACGALSATLISKAGIPPILATLGASDLILGVAMVLTKGSTISGVPPILAQVGTYTIFGFFPVTLLVFIICAMIVVGMLSRRPFGYKLYMLGTNADASMFSGIDNGKVIYQAYITSGVLASISGLLMCARFSTARADYGSSYTMQAILVCVLGGVNSNGGFGTVQGVTLAVLVLQVLSSGFNMFSNINNFYRDLIWGAALIFAIVMNYISNQNKQKRKMRALGTHTDEETKAK